jgi:hypothetical protein
MTMAEQNGLTRSIAYCSKIGTGKFLPIPPGLDPRLTAELQNLVSQIFPVGGTEAERQKKAYERCCTGPFGNK